MVFASTPFLSSIYFTGYSQPADKIRKSLMFFNPASQIGVSRMHKKNGVNWKWGEYAWKCGTCQGDGVCEDWENAWRCASDLHDMNTGGWGKSVWVGRLTSAMCNLLSSFPISLLKKLAWKFANSNCVTASCYNSMQVQIVCQVPKS